MVNGLHTPMSDDPTLMALLHDKCLDLGRAPRASAGLTVGSAQARLLPCLRVLTVGTDMSIGKMSTSLELHQGLAGAGVSSRDF